MKLFVTGAGGYIGTTLVPMLLDVDHEVIALDRFFFGRELLQEHPKLTIYEDDIRTFDASLLDGVEAVIDLAALSNDPSGELNLDWTWQINHAGRVRVANLAKERGVAQYMLPSSCSVYGFQEEVLTEESSTNPLTTYAKANLKAEEDILPLDDSNFDVIVIRQATVYGLSLRMRFDLAINGMIKGFFTKGKIPILRDGTQWRPFIHVKDTSRAMMMLLKAPREKVKGQRFNVGANKQNFQIFSLAQQVAESVDIPFNYEWYGDPDHRSYQVKFEKIRNVVGFEAKHSLQEAVREIWNVLENKAVDPNNPKTITVQWYKKLIEKGVEIGSSS
ncbi:NAD-dependent epimerase/dehydratase family protein [Candidatus Omnitrophota bacterium]